jgi:Retrotransposon gag protein
MKKIALVLMLMQGPEVEGWMADIGSALDLLDPMINNIPALWDQFLLEFAKQYQDTQAAERARAELENLRMKVPEIDQYISKFEDLCHKAGYTQGNTEVTHLFHKGLPRSILKETIKGPQDYALTKQ